MHRFLKVFKHEVMVIQSVWVLNFIGRTHPILLNSGLNVMRLDLLLFPVSSVRRPPVTSLLTGLWRDQGRSVGKAKQLFSPKHADQFWGPHSILLNKRRRFSRSKAARSEVNISGPLVSRLRSSAAIPSQMARWWPKSSHVTITVVSILKFTDRRKE